MHVVNISGLKNNPSEALHSARDDVVVVMNRDQPDAVIVGLQSGKLLSEPGARAALATALFRDGGLSLVRSARMARMPLATFITHASRLGISVAAQFVDPNPMADAAIIGLNLAAHGVGQSKRNPLR